VHALPVRRCRRAAWQKNIEKLELSEMARTLIEKSNFLISFFEDDLKKNLKNLKN
jgi:hypothetical protein